MMPPITRKPDPHEERFVVRQEKDLLPTAKLVAIGVTAVVVVIVSVALSGRILSCSRAEIVPAAAQPPPRHAPREIGIVDQTLVRYDDFGLRLRGEQQRALDAYGWVDRDAGVAHVPITRAMTLYLDRARSAGADGGAR